MVASTVTSRTLSSLQLEELNLTGKVRLKVRRNVGGFSDVYTGIFSQDGKERLVAIKELRACGNVSSDNEYDRLLIHLYREIAVWKKLQHENITPLLGFTNDPDYSPCLVSPWYTNGNVVNFLKNNPEADRLQLFLDAAEGLAYLHSLRLVHGDIKAENILVDDNQTAQLCDFGLSKFLDDANHISGLTTSTPMPGTIRFLSPELLDDTCPKTTMSDVWAFGCVGIQIITGQTPYQHLTRIQSVIYAIIKGDTPMPESHVQIYEFEVELWPIVQRCWRSEPSKRPTIKQLKSDIERVHLAFNYPPGATEMGVATPLVITLATDKPPPTSCGPGPPDTEVLEVAGQDEGERTVTGLDDVMEEVMGLASSDSKNITLKNFRIVKIGGTRVWREAGRENKHGKLSSQWKNPGSAGANWRSRQKGGYLTKEPNIKNTGSAIEGRDAWPIEWDRLHKNITGSSNDQNKPRGGSTVFGAYQPPDHHGFTKMDGSKGNQGINAKDRSILGEKNMMDGCTNLGLGKDQEVNHDKLWSQDPSKGGYGLGSRNEKSQPFKPYRSSDIKGFDGGRKLRDHSNIDGTIGHWKAYIFNSPAEPWNGLSIGGVDPNGSRNSWNSQGGTYEPTRSQGLWPYLPEGCNSITAGYKEVFT